MNQDHGRTAADARRPSSRSLAARAMFLAALAFLGAVLPPKPTLAAEDEPAAAAATRADSPILHEVLGLKEPIGTRAPAVPADGADAAQADATAPAAKAVAEDKAVPGSIVYYAGYPTLSSGLEVTQFGGYDDFQLTQATVVQAIRFWTLEEPGAWDGFAEYAILGDGNGLPGSTLQSGSVRVERFSTGSTTQGLSEFQYVFPLKAPLALAAGNYWLSLHLSSTCNFMRGVYWESGAPGFRSGAYADQFCDAAAASGTTIQLAFQVLGGVGAGITIAAEPAQIMPFFSNRLTNYDRGVAVDMASTIQVNSIGIMLNIGSPTNLSVAIREMTDKTLGAIVGGGNINVSTGGGPKFQDVPVNFTFVKGRRYDIAFNVTGGWGDPGQQDMELYLFNNQNFLAANTFMAGPFTILDGRGAPAMNFPSDPYSDPYLGRFRFGIPLPGFEAFGLQIGSPPQPLLVGFNLADPEIVVPISVLPDTGSNWVGLDFRPGAGTAEAYAINAATNQLARISVLTGIVTHVGTMVPQTGQTFSGMSFDPTDGNLYVSSMGSTSSRLYLVNPLSGFTTNVGTITNAQQIVGLAINQAGELYGLDIDGDDLILINKTTAAGTRIGSAPLSLDSSQGMDFDPVTGRLYGALFNAPAQRGELQIINTSTAATTLVGVFGSAFPRLALQLSSMAVTSDSTRTPTPTAATTATATPVSSFTPTATPGPTTTVTAAPTVTPSVTPTSVVTIRPTTSQTPTPSPSLTPTPLPNNAVILSQTFPDEVMHGSTQMVQVTVRNTGTETWSEASAYRLGVIADSCGVLPGARGFIPDGVAVAPGESFTFTLLLQVPSTPGTCSVTFQMLREFVEFFGTTLTVDFAIDSSLLLNFTQNGGNFFGWLGGVAGGSGSTEVNQYGICMNVPDPGDNTVLWFSPEGYVQLIDMMVYRIQADAGTDQTATNEIPFWNIMYDNFYTSGYGNIYGGEAWFLDTAGGANGIDRPQGRGDFELFAAPNAALTPQWRGLLSDGTTGVFNPTHDAVNDMRILFRVLDLGSGSYAANLDNGRVCINSMRIQALNMAAMPTFATPYGPPISTTHHAPFAFNQAPLFAEIDDARNVAVYQLGTTLDRATLLPAEAPAPYSIPDLYPVGWTSDTIYRASSGFQLPTGSTGTDPIDAILMNVDTPTSEIGVIHFSTRGSAGNMFRAASPRTAAVAGAPQTYIGFFYGHNRTLIGLDDYARVRPMVDIFNTPELFGAPTGSNPVEIHSLNMSIMGLP